MADHECVSTVMCTCSITALEPNEDCPVHMGALPDRHCDYCGKFVRKSQLMSMPL